MNPHNSRRVFQTTRWSVVRHAGGDDAAAETALATLCNSYWYPLYAYFRSRGNNPPDAEDLTQGFFLWLIEHKTLAKADPALGKLRNYLLKCAQRFLSDERDRQCAEKRGGPLVAGFDLAQAEKKYTAEPVDDLSPDRLFQRRWIIEVLEMSMQALGREFASGSDPRLFEVLRPHLGFGSAPERPYAEIALSLGVPEGTLKSHVSRLRQRWPELLFEQVAETLDNPTDHEIRDELSELRGCVYGA